MKLRIITTDKNIVLILAELLISTSFNNDYYYSLYLYEDTKENKYILIIEDTQTVINNLAKLISKLSDIKTISWNEDYAITSSYELLMTNYIPNENK